MRVVVTGQRVAEAIEETNKGGMETNHVDPEI